MRIDKNLARLLLVMIDCSEAARKMHDRAASEKLYDAEKAIIEALKAHAIDRRKNWQTFQSNKDMTDTAEAVIKKLSHKP